MEPTCSLLDAYVADGRSDPALVAINQAPELSDGVNAIVFDDPDASLGLEAGVLAAAWGASTPGAVAVLRDGIPYFQHAGTVDIVFSGAVDWATSDALDDGACEGAYSFEATLTHELGHLLGLGHSCERFDRCTDPLLRGATMYYSTPPCDPGVVEPNLDDREGLGALYGPSLSIDCSRSSDHGVLGVAPLALECVASPINGLVLAEDPVWDLGDGARATGVRIAHTYEEAGVYDLSVAWEGTGPGCAEGVAEVLERPGFVRVCEVPEARFEVLRGDGLQVQLSNDSDLSTFGCVSDVRWEVFEELRTTLDPVVGPLEAWEPVIELPAPGTYTAVLHVGGPAGTASARATFEVGAPRGCQHGGGAAGFLPMVVLWLTLGVRSASPRGARRR